VTETGRLTAIETSTRPWPSPRSGRHAPYLRQGLEIWRTVAGSIEASLDKEFEQLESGVCPGMRDLWADQAPFPPWEWRKRK